MKYIQSEIVYKKDNNWIQRNIIQNNNNNLNSYQRNYLHCCLDEWIDNANGSGCFYLKDSDFFIK